MSQVKFRRIRGRIIPIRERSKNAAIGGAALATGAVVAGSGQYAERVAVAAIRKGSRAAFGALVTAQDIIRKANKQTSFDFAKPAHVLKAEQTLARSKFSLRALSIALKRLPAIGTGAKLVGAAVAGFGAAKLFEAVSPKSSETERLAASAATTAGFTVASFGSKIGLASKPHRSKLMSEGLKIIRKRFTRGILR